MNPRRVSPALLALTASLAACSKPAVESYRAPKYPPPAKAAAATPHTHAAGPTPPAAPPPAAPAPAATTGGAMANTAVPTASGPGLAWTAPAAWTAKAGSPMRKATYVIKGDGGEAELAITAFPGDVGGDLANVNRWRGQINLPPIGAGDLAGAVQRLEFNGLKLGVVDLGGAAGSGAQRTLAAIVPHAGSSWFFKLTGPDAIVAGAKPAFMEFLATIKPSAP
jgi:hypothetical protein